MLRALAEQYARLAREFSDTVALLGSYNHTEPEVQAIFRKIQQQRALCADAEWKLERYLEHSKKAGAA